MKGGTDTRRTEQQEFICVATFLPLNSWKDFIPFMILSRKVLKQIENGKGIVNYGVKANLPKEFFWTLSIWNDHESLKLFVLTEPQLLLSKSSQNGLEWALPL